MSLTKSRTKHKKPVVGGSRSRVSKRGEHTRPAAVGLRERFLLTQAQFAPLLSVSIRSLASLETGVPPTPTVARRISELMRLAQALAEVIDRKAIGGWMLTPNAAFDGLKPVEVIERGEVDRIWAMVHALRSGEPA
jgi:DNA-binding XRE family transcriptional regulator